MTTCGEAIIELLQAQGVDVVFGIPGVHTVDLYRGLAASRIRHVAPHHEQSAGFMADGYARASGRPGVCLLITGPGLANAATALAQSYSDSVPVLAVSSVNRRSELGLGRGLLHELPNQQQLSENFTAFSHTLLEPENLPSVLQRAFDSFACARPRPVHVEVPMDVLTAPFSGTLAVAQAPSLPAPEPSALQQAASMLSSAHRPLLILGGGAVNAARHAQAFVEAAAIPVVLSVAAKGVIPATHPLCLGSSLTSGSTQALVRDADVVIAIGTELADTDSWNGGVPLEMQGQLVRIDIDAHQMRRNASPMLAIVSDAGLALSALAERAAAVPQALPDRQAWVRRVAEAKVVQRTPEQTRHCQLLDIIHSVLPEDGLITADSTQIVYTGNRTFASQKPRSWLTSTTGFGTLGYALPAAIGAKLACPERTVVCLAGDGGLLFSIPELAVAAREKLPMAVVVWSNDGYREIRDAMQERQVSPIGTDFRTPDLLALARGFGCAAARAESAEQLATLMRESFAAQGPTLIEVRADASFLS